MFFYFSSLRRLDEFPPLQNKITRDLSENYFSTGLRDIFQIKQTAPFQMKSSEHVSQLNIESVFICQNTDWFKFCRSNMAINASKLQCGKPVKAHLLVCLEVKRGKHFIGRI